MGTYNQDYGILVYGDERLQRILPTLKFYVGSQVPSHAINLAYISSPAISASDFVRIVNDLNINMEHISSFDCFKTTNSSGKINGSITSYSDYCYITDRFYADITAWTNEIDKHTILSTALWYRYHLRAYAIDRPRLSVGPIDNSNIFVIGPTGDILDDSFLLYKIYIDRVIDSSKGIYDCSIWTNFQDRGYVVCYSPVEGNSNHKETLNPMPLFFQGNNAIDLSYKASLLGRTYNITCNYKFIPNSFVAIRFPANDFFNVTLPFYGNRDDNWYLKIGRGQFYINHLTYKNHLYYTQNFIPNMMPAIKIIDDPCVILASNKIQLTHAPILFGYYNQVTHKISSNISFPISIRINDTLYTTKDANIEDFSGIVDVDNQTGIITLPIDLQDGDIIRATYYVWELYYRYRGYINTNGIYMHLDTNPNYGHYIVKDTMYQSYIASNQVIGLPISIWINPDTGVNAPIINIYHTYSDSPNVTGTPYQLNQTLRLAFVNIADYIYEPVIMDARSYGGGLNKDISPANNYDAFWDIGFWEGQPYQSNGVFVVDINNSLFTKDYIKAIIDKYKAAGTLGLLTHRSGSGSI